MKTGTPRRSAISAPGRMPPQLGRIALRCTRSCSWSTGPGHAHAGGEHALARDAAPPRAPRRRASAASVERAECRRGRRRSSMTRSARTVRLRSATATCTSSWPKSMPTTAPARRSSVSRTGGRPCDCWQLRRRRRCASSSRRRALRPAARRRGWRRSSATGPCAARSPRGSRSRGARSASMTRRRLCARSDSSDPYSTLTDARTLADASAICQGFVQKNGRSAALLFALRTWVRCGAGLAALGEVAARRRGGARPAAARSRARRPRPWSRGSACRRSGPGRARRCRARSRRCCARGCGTGPCRRGPRASGRPLLLLARGRGGAGGRARARGFLTFGQPVKLAPVRTRSVYGVLALAWRTTKRPPQNSPVCVRPWPSRTLVSRMWLLVASTVEPTGIDVASVERDVRFGAGQPDQRLAARGVDGDALAEDRRGGRAGSACRRRGPRRSAVVGGGGRGAGRRGRRRAAVGAVVVRAGRRRRVRGRSGRRRRIGRAPGRASAPRPGGAGSYS